MKQLQGAFPGLSDKFVECIFNDIDQFDKDEHDHSTLKITTILRWINVKKKRTNTEVQRDEKWLYRKLKETKFTELDDDENGELDLDEFQASFGREGVDASVVEIVFNAIDANGDGSVSVKEWFQWQSKFKQSDFKKLFPENK